MTLPEDDVTPELENEEGKCRIRDSFKNVCAFFMFFVDKRAEHKVTHICRTLCMSGVLIDLSFILMPRSKKFRFSKYLYSQRTNVPYLTTDLLFEQTKIFKSICNAIQKLIMKKI